MQFVSSYNKIRVQNYFAQYTSNPMDLINSNTKHKLLIKAITWLKDSHNLFDYQFTKNITKQQFKISLQPSFVFFYRNNAKSEIILIKEQKMIPKQMEGCQLLGCFEIKICKQKNYKLEFHEPWEFDLIHNKYDKVITQVSNNSGDYKQDGIYFIVRSLKDDEQEPKGFVLKSNQKVKFGRIQYNVKVVKKSDEDCQNPNFFDYEQTLVVDDNKIYDQEDACRICLSNEQNEENGLFFCTPCDCYGSCSLVHFYCLLEWCRTKVKKTKLSNSIHQYNFSKFECEICKKYFPRFITKKGKKYDLLPIEKPEKPYLALSSVENGQISEKGLILISYYSDSLLKIGRNQCCDIRLVDISVSRQHASIEMRDEEFFLFDNKSKFGTIVSEPNFTLDVEKVKRGIQIGRTVLTFQMAEKQWEKSKKL